MKLTGGIQSQILACCMIVAAVVTAAAGVSALTSDARQDPAAALANAAVEKPSARDASTAPTVPALSEWDKRWWIEKTARLLRNGDGLGPNDDIERLSKLSKQEIAREFMSDERFGDTVLDFNMFFMGFKIDSLKVDGIYAHSAFDFANAISSAKALVDGGDYLKLFDLEGDYYPAPLTMIPSEEPLGPEDAKLTPTQLREKAIGELKARLAALLNMRSGPNPIGARRLLRTDRWADEQQVEINQKLFRAFTDARNFHTCARRRPRFHL